MGYCTFKLDKEGKVWFGIVMEIDNRNEGQDCAVSASQLANGSLVYSVSWTSNKKQRPALYIRAPKKRLKL
jgi:hypothetical protein